jgi:hypothetical protein
VSTLGYLAATAGLMAHTIIAIVLARGILDRAHTGISPGGIRLGVVLLAAAIFVIAALITTAMNGWISELVTLLLVCWLFCWAVALFAALVADRELWPERTRDPWED